MRTCALARLHTHAMCDSLLTFAAQHNPVFHL